MVRTTENDMEKANGRKDWTKKGKCNRPNNVAHDAVHELSKNKLIWQPRSMETKPYTKTLDLSLYHRKTR